MPGRLRVFSQLYVTDSARPPAELAVRGALPDLTKRRNRVIMSSPELRPSDRFARLTAPETGRAAVQLTSGPGHCYPLYYYVPSLTADGRYLVHHRAWDGQVQLFRLDLASGESVQLTRARSADARWRPWQTDSGTGVLDFRSVLNRARDEVIYFEERQGRAVHVESLEDRPLFELPRGREAIGQNGCTPDGRHFAFVHAPAGSQYGEPCQGAAVAAYDFETAAVRDLLAIDAAIDHVTPYDNRHIVFSHPDRITGIMLASLEGGAWRTLRDDEPGAEGRIVHAAMTARGIAYEVPDARRAGLLDPRSGRRVEWALAESFGYVHSGRDPEGRLLFYENADAFHNPTVHDLWALRRVSPDGRGQWQRLVGNWPTYATGQRAHFHPQLLPDRRWLLLTAGDPATRTDQVFLLDVSEMGETEGIV